MDMDLEVLHGPKFKSAPPETTWPKQLIGIDLGCFGSRIMVVCPIARPSDDPDDTLVRAIPPPERVDNTPLDWLDFPAHGYPFDDDAPAYDPSVRWRQFEPVPLKYAFYLLAKELDKAAPQHPMAQELAIYDSPEFRSKLYSGLVALFRSMRARKDADLAERWGQAFTDNQAKDHICVTIPAQWNCSFREVYLDVISEAFDIHRETVHEHVTFVTESDAWAHVFLGPLHGGAWFRDDAMSEEVVLILTFGGHMMNGSVFWLGPTDYDGDGPGESGSNRFFRIGDSFGAHGSGELLMHYLLEYADDLFSTQTGRALSPTEKAGVHDACTRLIRNLNPRLDISSMDRIVTIEVITDTGGKVRLEIPRTGFDHFRECAYRHPLNVAAQQFALLSRIMRDRKVAGSVMISGGCLEYDYLFSPLQLRLQQLAEDAGLPRPHFERRNYDPEQDSAIRGAIATVEYALTARQFITQGVGIGLQRKLPDAPEWEDKASLLFYYDIVAREYRQYTYTSAGPQVEGTQFRLICDPLYHVIPPVSRYSDEKYRAPKPKSKAERIPIGSLRTYVLFDDLPTAQKGDKYECEVSLEGSGNDTFVVAKVEQTGQLNQTRTTDLRLRLRFDPATRHAKVIMKPKRKEAISMRVRRRNTTRQASRLLLTQR